MVRIYRKYLVSYDDRTPSANAIRMIKYFSLKVTFQANCFDIWKLFKIWPNHWPLNLAKSWQKIVEQFNSKINLKAFQSSLKMLSSGSTLVMLRYNNYSSIDVSSKDLLTINVWSNQFKGFIFTYRWYYKTFFLTFW